MKIVHFFLLFLLSAFHLSAFGKFIQIEHPSTLPGMFSVFNTVVGCLDLYETYGYQGLSVNFGTDGHYYDAELGPNWWTYFLEPLEIGSKEKCKITTVKYSNAMERALYTERKLSRLRVHQIIERYFRFKPFVLNYVEDFIRENFKGKRVIGIHYRGTDKTEESPKVPYEVALNEIRKVLGKNDLLFVATDEESFLQFLQNAFPTQVIFANAVRATTPLPIHKNHQGTSGFQMGLEALTDAFVLSRCDLLIRTSSNLSLFSTYFNPHLKQIELNQRYQIGKQKKL